MGDGPTFCYNLGYSGYAKFKDKTSNTEYIMLATSGNFQLTHNQMFTTGVYGGTIANASHHIASAPDYPSVSANIDFQLTTQSIFFSSLGNSISSYRYKWNQVSIYPNGWAGYRSCMYTESLQYGTQQDSLVTGNVSFKGTDVNSVKTDSEVNFSTKNHKIGQNILSSSAPKYISVFPYYGTTWNFASKAYGVTKEGQHDYDVTQLKKDIMSWNLRASQQINFVKICNCNAQQIDAIKADFAVIGFTQVSGGMQLIGINQRFEKGYIFYYIDGETTITMRSADDGQNSGSLFKITIPNMQCQDISSSLQTGSNLITTSFNFMVMGRKDPTNTKTLISYTMDRYN